MIQTAERVSADELSDNFVYQRSLFAYKEAASWVRGSVLELGTGSGYGVIHLSKNSEVFLTVDKYRNAGFHFPPEIAFKQMKIPPLTGLLDESFDRVFSFQLIEHIKNDKLLVSEVARVLKPGGYFVVTTPNRLMSLSRNPWHVREYSASELSQLLALSFDKIEALGVFAKDHALEYYLENKNVVSQLMNWDIFNLQYRLPSWLLRIPYDLVNRWNRNKLMHQDVQLLKQISQEHFELGEAADDCLDLFFVAQKRF